MDPDEVARLVGELKISQEATQATVNFSNMGQNPTTNELRRFLVGKVFSSRVVNREALRANVPKILQLRRTVDIEIVGDNIFVIVFTSEDDRRHALYDGPWHFFNNLMVFKAPIGLQNPSDIVFDEFSVWAQVHNLPFVCMNPTAIRKIAEHIGAVEEVDMSDGGSCIGQFARVRVRRLIDKPLQRCIRLAEETSGDSQIVLALYEKLPDYCHACGRVGHVLRYCNDDSADKEQLAFGPWLRASKVVEVRRLRGGTNQGMRGRGRFVNRSNPMVFDDEETPDRIGNSSED